MYRRHLVLPVYWSAEDRYPYFQLSINIRIRSCWSPSAHRLSRFLGAKCDCAAFAGALAWDMTSPVSLNFEPPEPPGDRDWPPYVRLTYGRYERRYVSGDEYKNEESLYPLQWVGWLIRYAHHVTSLLHDGLDRLSDEAVLAAATLKDLAEEISFKKDEEEPRALLLDAQERLIARMRACQLPTSADLYSAPEAVTVLDRWEPEVQDAHTEASVVMDFYLEDVGGVVERLKVEHVRRSPAVEVQTSEEMQAATIMQLRALLAQLETGAFAVREVRTTQRGWLEEIVIQGRHTPVERTES